jgi:epidermal growth factor receptor substrate 15
MHLIQGKLAGQDLPTTLPPTLVPPSVQKTIGIINGSPFSVSSPVAPEPTRDLIWDDSPPTSATQPQITGSSLQPQSTGARSAFTPQTASPPKPPTAVHDPFTSNTFGGSSFGQGSVPYTLGFSF